MEQNVEEILKASLDLEVFTSMLQKQNQMRKEDKLCDVTLQINNKDLFKVHKTVLAASCEYFSGLFNGDWKETRQDVISLDYEISPDCFELLLEYLYTSNLALSVISYENAIVLHKAALFFNLLKLKSIMSKILQKFITSETLLSLWRHGVTYFDDPLKDKCLELIAESSNDFFEQNLCELTFEELKNLCEKKILTCTQEENYENFIKWAKADFESREKYLIELLYLVDFSQISGKFIKSKILSDEILFKNVEIVKMIMRELSNNLEIMEKRSIETTVNEDKKLYILLLSTTGIFKIDLESRICESLLSYKLPRHFAVTKFGSNILISGGLISGGVETNICKCYYPELNLIRKFPPMLEKRYGHKALAYGDKIYVFGGSVFGGYESDSMEIFDIGIGKWSFGPKMPRQRYFFGLEEYDGCIYLMGNDAPTDIFDVGKMKWTSDVALENVTRNIVRIDSTGYIFKSDGCHKYDFQNKILKENCVTFQEMVWYDSNAIKFNNKIFFIGKKESGKIFSALIDTETDTLTEIEIDFTQCGDTGVKFQLTTAYL